MAKNVTSNVTANDNNATRRAVKARQQANARVRAAERKGTQQVLSLSDVRKEQKKRENYVNSMKSRAEILVKQALNTGMAEIRKGDLEGYKILERATIDLVRSQFNDRLKYIQTTDKGEPKLVLRRK